MKRTLFTTLGLSILLATGCASTQYAEDTSADVGFADWDADRNGMIADAEFRAGFTQNGWFNELDRDRDGRVTNEEFGMASTGWGLDGNAFATWDTNRDGVLDDGEFGTGAFSTWDRNRDSMLDDSEFAAGEGWFD
ncbi:hypothetical protein [Cognatilysobacter bugurensis]|uniref:EF-hand domain-containing protein n=1 Tax=Cognatilysobacter bugurensis TaxID=543356 RepID=A0A918SXX1_9GAMM|nr:hypothetical protein [Lysobacter bugurensis]GHA72596.1 hypothetical protein GCM10007067_06390 [Lysobacter bugurensis]